MAQIWENWRDLASQMLAEAEVSFDAGNFLTTAFIVHQVAEQALKALWVIRSDGVPPRTHDLTDLADELDAPAAVRDACADLNPLYMNTRYPDAANGNPGRIHTRTSVNRNIESARLVHGWVITEIDAIQGGER